MKNSYQYIFRTGTAALLISAMSACSSHQPPQTAGTDSTITVTVAKVSASTSDQISLSGQLTSTQTAAISTRIMGYITAIHVKIGDKVAKGQLLVSIASQDIAAKQAQADAGVMQAQAALENAKKDYERYKALFSQQSATQKELDNMTLLYHSAQGQLTVAKEMRKEADANMAYANLTAPFSGIITQKMADAGSIANPGIPLLMLEQAGSYQVSAYATESQIALLQTGMSLTVNIGSSNKIRNATITEISRSAENTGGQYLLKANIPGNESSDLYSGMYVNVIIPVKSISGMDDNQVWVPASAIVHQDELDGIYTVSHDNRAMLRWLRLGKTQGERVEVLSGLSPDDAFISGAEGRLFNGVPVKIK
ncbi:efflux RND transporter periplasmic adaptor subunit [Mucilaginibacter sp. HC2]|uniref:efflux RND transporter periplasmic adaptor subunit n=1 Tax=Mucilaginibacter inviolabilis TaxID=2714892 RepID=UPI00140AC3B8|nr:efflux RND transporter periplasmic adaptor subunit [Mucilaginibacter inviolabilis]NHA02671.1 efflux RND transporter periplasmic adaptor subunit [Mucilaginibacter inviolabilis]